MHVNCTHCNALCQVPESLLGNRVKCGKCSQVFVAEVEEAAEAEIAEAAEFIEEGEGDFGFEEGDDDGEIGFDFDASDEEILGEEEQTGDEPILGINPPAIHGLHRYDIGSCTSTGKVRERNEDSFLVQHHVCSNLDTRQELALCVVADGMGGHEAGDRASKMTFQHVAASLAPVIATFYKMEGKAPPSYRAPMEAALKAANTEVHKVSVAETGKKGMGSTAAMAIIRGEAADIVHVGDCRVYHYRNGDLQQVTKDQTIVERMIDTGQLTREEAEEHEVRNEVTQAVGIRADIEPAYNSLKMAANDWLILACDGLHAHVKADMLAEALAAAPASAAQVAHYLVDLANYHGGSDNCTVVAVRCF